MSRFLLGLLLLAMPPAVGHAQPVFQCPIGTIPARNTAGEQMCRCPDGALVTSAQVCAKSLSGPVTPEAGPIPAQPMAPLPGMAPSNPVPVPGPLGAGS
jgi:hypothetical protein